MRAVAARSGELRMVDIPQPEPAEGEVLVKNLACGICGSDLHFMLYGEEMMRGSSQSGNAQFAPDFSRDIVMGHEFCCEVVAYGPNTNETVPVGSRITSVPSKGAYSNVYPGAYSEYMVLDAGMVLPVPDHVATEHAATTEPMAVGMHAARAGQFLGRRAGRRLRLRSGRLWRRSRVCGMRARGRLWPRTCRRRVGSWRV